MNSSASGYLASLLIAAKFNFIFKHTIKIKNLKLFSRLIEYFEIKIQRYKLKKTTNKKVNFSKQHFHLDLVSYFRSFPSFHIFQFLVFALKSLQLMN